MWRLKRKQPTWSKKKYTTNWRNNPRHGRWNFTSNYLSIYLKKVLYSLGKNGSQFTLWKGTRKFCYNARYTVFQMSLKVKWTRRSEWCCNGTAVQESENRKRLNYRLISLLPTIYKIFSKVLTTSLSPGVGLSSK